MNTNKKIKIVHIAQANGGVEVYLKMFFKYFNSNKYENYLILSQQYDNSKSYFEKLGISVFIVDMYREISLVKDIRSMSSIFKILKNIKPNIVYTHSSKAGGLGRIPAKLIGAKNVYNPHGWAFDMNISNIKKSLFIYVEKILACITDQIIAISNYEKEIAIENGIVKENKITVIENAIDLDNFNHKYNRTEILSEFNWREDDIVIGMIARISEQKSPSTFVNIAEKVSAKYSSCKFIMVGDGDQRQEIENMIEEKGLKSKFCITGWVKNPYKYLSVFDIALLTSKWEGFGLVIPEYMAAKKPVIASDVGGISTIIEHYVDGFLVSDLNVNKFVECISLLIENREVTENITYRALEKVKNSYNFLRVSKQHEEVFQYLYNKLNNIIQ